ncbi:MAG: DUF1302 family protein [Pseudomonadota bacterium]
MKPFAILVTALLAATTAHSETALTWSADASLTQSVATDTDSGVQTLFEILPAANITVGRTTKFVTSARVRLDNSDRIEPGTPEYGNYWVGSRPQQLGTAGSLELRDAYAQLAIPRGILRLGKQQIVWGKMDGIKILDVINPQDFRYFIAEEFSDSRVTLWSAYADISFGSWRTELAVVPDSSGHVIPDAGAWFELRAPRFRFGATETATEVPVRTEEPSRSLDDTGFGLRLSRSVGSMTWSAVAFSGRDPEPIGALTADSDGPQLLRTLERRETYGISADVSLGPVVARMEYAFHPRRWFNVRTEEGLDGTRRNQSRAAIGFDIAGPFDTFINTQYFEDRVSGSAVGLVRPNKDRIATLALRKAIGFDQWELETRFYRSLSDGDSMLTASLRHSLSQRTSLLIEALTFRGDDRGFFGQFNDRDMITIRLSHSFR